MPDVGSRIAHYEVTDRLGAGGMGACGHAEPRTWGSEARHQRQFAAGAGPRGQWKKADA